MHLFLTGMMGSGKTAVGLILADKLGYDYVDLDREIVRQSNKSIEKIFEEDGETVFREMESETAYDLKLDKPSVIATGGGFPLKESNRNWMKKNGTVIWLKSAPPVILERIKFEDRPLLPKPIDVRHIEDILSRRIGIYELADMAIDTDHRSPEEIAETIKRLVE